MRPQEKTLPARDMDKLSGTVLGVHIGVYQPWYSVLFGNTCSLIHSNKDQIQFTYLIKDSIIMDVIIAQKSLIW